jgi:hypothetical protein
MNINNNIPFNSNQEKNTVKNKSSEEINQSFSNHDFDANENANLNLDSDSDSDSDEYVDLSSNIESKSEDIYQFLVVENKLELKHIGKFTKAPDIIIKENFGPNSNMNLFSCVYTFSEITTKSDELFFPLVKLVVKNEINIIITCIAIKLIKPVMIENSINEWDLYWLENKSDTEHIKMCKIEKNINSTNIIEKLIGYSVNN